MAQVRIDKGASFYKCDFQVHTPRDINWQGEFKGAVSEEQRNAFATALIQDCHRKGLEAIAVTDHHDLCLFSYVRSATSAVGGNAAGNQVIVFPGIELTLSNPSCQALLLLDPDTSDTALKSVFGALGLSPNPDNHSSTVTTEELQSHMNLRAIHGALDPLVFNPDEPNNGKRIKLEGHYILLPHVRPGGHKTLMRKGMQTHYAEMPCVGGYIEGHFYDGIEVGSKKILQGKDANWGSKSVGVLQTSDNRECRALAGKIYDFVNLGNWPTWVKWTKPTVEAIRQACLAKGSRISHCQPELPNRYISSVTISDSTFLGGEHLGINPQFNAFIGGRGTGKSSMMEYIRWALCDDPAAFRVSLDRDDELPDFEKRRKSLINKTLKPKSGTVTVQYVTNGTPYQVTRSASESAEKVTVISPDGRSREMTGNQVRLEFPLVSYAQKQLSCVGTLPEEVHRLIKEPIESKVSHLNDELKNSILPKLQERRQNEIRRKEFEEKEKDLSNRRDLCLEQIVILQATLDTSVAKDRETIEAHTSIMREKQWRDGVSSRISQLNDLILSTRASVDGFADLSVPPDLPSHESALLVAEDVNNTRHAVLSALDEVTNNLLVRTTINEDASRALNKIDVLHEQHQQDYETALKRQEAQSSVVSKLSILHEQLETLSSDLIPVSSEGERLTAFLQQPGEDWWELWLKRHKERAEAFREQCRVTSQRADNAFRATVNLCGNKAQVEDAVVSLLSMGKNIHGKNEKVAALSKIVYGADSPLTAWSQLIDELAYLVANKDGDILPNCPIVASAGFTDTNISALQSGLTGAIIEASRFRLFDDEIIFEFAFGQDESGADIFIPFEDASPGQQATALLKTLLAEAGSPLLIDQPEEDLDNEQMYNISNRIVQTKANRQLLFVSHNANIVVNGDAELVVCFAYQDPNNRTKGTIEKTGSIDYEPIRNSIASVMEGGRDAFQLRYQKYGY